MFFRLVQQQHKKRQAVEDAKNNYLSYHVGRARRKNRNAVDQEAALFLRPEFQYP